MESDVTTFVSEFVLAVITDSGMITSTEVFILICMRLKVEIV